MCGRKGLTTYRKALFLMDCRYNRLASRRTKEKGVVFPFITSQSLSDSSPSNVGINLFSAGSCGSMIVGHCTLLWTSWTRPDTYQSAFSSPKASPSTDSSVDD